MSAPVEDEVSASQDNTLSPLPGEAGIPSVGQRAPVIVPKKNIAAVILAFLTVIAVTAISIQRFVTSDKRPGDPTSMRVGDRPAAATGEPRMLDMTTAPMVGPASSPRPAARIPAIVPTDEEAAEPIGVRRTGQAAPTSNGPKAIPPEDAPTLLVTSRPTASSANNPPGLPRERVAGQVGAGPSSPLDETRRNLEAYERQLQSLLDALTKSASASPPTGVPSSGGASVGGPRALGPAPAHTGPATGGLFGGQLQGSATPRVGAAMLGNRSLILPKGTAFTCALATRIVSAASGFVSCLVQRNVFGDDGRVLLIERGSHVDGEYRIVSVKPGTVRIPVLWTRVRTPNGVTVEIESPGTGPLGESGIDGYVDNRWPERIGAAMLLSLIDDSVQLAVQHGSSTSQGNAVVLPSTTANTSKLAEKVLDSTIGIPPLIYQNQGGIVGVYVARDVDFSPVYELRPAAEGARP